MLAMSTLEAPYLLSRLNKILHQLNLKNCQLHWYASECGARLCMQKTLIKLNWKAKTS
jgi:hypothetical protein